MSHTNVDSKKAYHVTNSTIAYVDDKEQKIEDPVGGININGKDVKEANIAIPLNREYRLISDDGKKLVFKAVSKEEVEAKKRELEQKQAKSL